MSKFKFLKHNIIFNQCNLRIVPHPAKFWTSSYWFRCNATLLAMDLTYREINPPTQVTCSVNLSAFQLSQDENYWQNDIFSRQLRWIDFTVLVVNSNKLYQDSQARPIISQISWKNEDRVQTISLSLLISWSREIVHFIVF